MQALTVLPRTEDIPTRFAPAASMIPAKTSPQVTPQQTLGDAFHAAVVPTASSEPASQSIQMGSPDHLTIAGPTVDLTCMLACRYKDRLAKRRLHMEKNSQFTRAKNFHFTSHVSSNKQCVPEKHRRSILSPKTFCFFEQKPADAGQDHVKCTACILSHQHDITARLRKH